VVSLSHGGELQFREGFGTAAPGATEPLQPDAQFEFPAVTEVLVGAVAGTLASRGLLDLDAPISAQLPDLSARVGAVTLRQLLTHSAGLDNATVAPDADWSVELDRLNQRALFTEPGAIFSYSRYSYPLVARVVEVVTNMGIAESMRTTLLDPIGIGPDALDLAAAADGLPVTRATVEGLARFWTAWLAGEVQGVGPGMLSAASGGAPLLAGRRFESGFWVDPIGPAPRISLMCGASQTGYAGGFQVYPETGTIMVFWSRYDLEVPEGRVASASPDRWPGATARFTLGRVAAALGLGDEVYLPAFLSGGGRLDEPADRCAEIEVSEQRVEDFGPRAPAADWAGDYLNGDRHFQLDEEDGLLINPLNPGRAPFRVHHYRDDVYFTDMERPGGPLTGFAFRLVRDEAGRRYVILGDRAHLRLEDRAGG
jgi:CubicO group peptidase (beta-lactamase class C family)